MGLVYCIWYRRRGSPDIRPQRLEKFRWRVKREALDLARPERAGLGPGVHSVQKAFFRKEGEYWTVGFGGKAFRLKDTKGLGYLAHLLRHPGAEFHVLDLAKRNCKPARGGRNQSAGARLAAGG